MYWFDPFLYHLYDRNPVKKMRLQPELHLLLLKGIKYVIWFYVPASREINGMFEFYIWFLLLFLDLHIREQN